METFFIYLKVFITGGILCAIAQVLIEWTAITPARILVLYVTGGVFLTAIGLYPYIVEFGGAGATVPLTGFGYALAKGVEVAVKSGGWSGVITGGITATAAGISAAIFFGLIAAIIFKSQDKS